MAVDERTATGPSPGAAPRVLVVEDDHDTRSALCSILIDGGYEALQAEDGKKALDTLVSNVASQPFLVVLDLDLPILSGYDLLEIMRRYRRLSTIPVLVITGQAWPQALSARRSVVGYLRKPIDALRLLAIVAQHAPVSAKPSEDPELESGIEPKEFARAPSLSAGIRR